MKELSIKEKAKAYDEVLERAKEKYSIFEGMKQGDVLEDVFPELKESEDERIRKAIICGMHALKDQKKTCFASIPIDDVIAWLEKQGKNNMSISEATKQVLEDNLNKALEKETPESCNEFIEKQGEQKTVENKDYSAPLDIEIPFGAKDSELIQETIRIPDGCYAFIEGNEIVIKKGEKPAWSEEDEVALSDALWCCKQAASTAKDENDMGNVWYAEHWLKSLKDRYAWKPSNEQMETLENVRKILHTNKGIYSKANHFMFNFEELIRTLKKLREK